MKKTILFLIILLFSGSAFASSGSIYRSSPEEMLSGGGIAESADYLTENALGGNATGTASNPSYSTDLGFAASSITYAATEEEPPIDTTNTVIYNIRFDGQSILSDDYVNPDVTITTTVTNSSTGINTSASFVEIDSDTYFFSALTGDSSYTASGLLTFKNPTPFSDGAHTLKIIAVDNAANITSESISFTAKRGGPTVVGPVLNLPNPFNPNEGSGSTEITYHLNKEANITVYIFNSIGQLVWKRELAAGAEGGHAGYNVVLWDGKADSGEIVSNDIYFCRIVSGGKVIGKGKIAVIK